MLSGDRLQNSKEIGKAWRKSLTRANCASLTRPFGCWRVLEYANIRTVLQSKATSKAATATKTSWSNKQNNNFARAAPFISLPLFWTTNLHDYNVKLSENFLVTSFMGD